MKTITLYQAYRWVCDACGFEHFAKPADAIIDDDTRERAFRELHGLEDWQSLPDDWREFSIVAIPQFVVCVNCGERYATHDCRSDADDEDDGQFDDLYLDDFDT